MDDAWRALSRDEIVEWMGPSFAAMLAKMGRRAKQDPHVLAAKVFEQLALCRVTMVRGPGAAARGTPGPGWRASPL